MTRIRFTTAGKPAPFARWECALCTRLNADGRIIWHTGTPHYYAQSLPSGLIVYACEAADLMGEAGQRAIDDWIEARLPYLRAEPVCEREPYLTEGPAHVAGSTLTRRGRR